MDDGTVVSEKRPLTKEERAYLEMAKGPETKWVVPRDGSERTVEDQAIIRVIDGLYARDLLRLTRCGPDGEDNRYQITDAGLEALEIAVPLEDE